MKTMLDHVGVIPNSPTVSFNVARWTTAIPMLLILSIALSDAPDGFLDKPLVDCLQAGNCGAFSMCSYSFSYKEPCTASDNCTLSKDGTKESLARGNIMLLKNGMGKVTEYTWNVVGYYYDVAKDDASARRYVMPAYSYVYFDTGIPTHHTVRIINDGQVVNTEISSNRECTIHEACDYMLKTCQGSFVFLDTFSLSPKIKCAIYSKACKYFVYAPDLSIKAMGPSSSSPPSDRTYAPSDGPKSSVTAVREAASECMVDCLWNYYPSMWLPSSRLEVIEMTDSLDVVRRLHLGITTGIDACSDKVFVDDRVDIFRTTDDDEMYALLNHGETPGNNRAVVGLLGAVVAFLVLCLVVLLGREYYIRRYGSRVEFENATDRSSFADNNGFETL